MSAALIIPVKETMAELRKALKNSKPIFGPRIKMLIEMKKEGEKGISKRELMSRIGASSQSIHNWRTTYKEGGLDKLLSHHRTGFKPSIFTKEENLRLRELLHDPNNDISGYSELREWVKKEFDKDVKYNSLLKYCVQNFGAKTKVARKSHVGKDEASVGTFKKTLVIPANRP